MKRCPYCGEEMLEFTYYDDPNKEYECWYCKRAFKENLSFLGRILRKFKLI